MEAAQRKRLHTATDARAVLFDEQVAPALKIVDDRVSSAAAIRRAEAVRGFEAFNTLQDRVAVAILSVVIVGLLLLGILGMVLRALQRRAEADMIKLARINAEAAAQQQLGGASATLGSMDRPGMKLSGPVLCAPDVARLTRFYECLLGWEVRELYGPRPGYPPGDGWSRLRPAEGNTKIEIQFEQHYQRPVWPGAPGSQGMQMHLDIWVEDVSAGVAWAIGCGATQAEQQPENRDPSHLRIMLDPAGHPFCLWS